MGQNFSILKPPIVTYRLCIGAITVLFYFILKALYFGRLLCSLHQQSLLSKVSDKWWEDRPALLIILQLDQGPDVRENAVIYTPGLGVVQDLKYGVSPPYRRLTIQSYPLKPHNNAFSLLEFPPLFLVLVLRFPL